MPSGEQLVVLVSAEPESVMGGHAATFCLESLRQGHEIIRVFFYGDGVMHAIEQLNPEDEQPIVKWSDIANLGVDLCVCVSAALRRGVLDTEHGERHSLNPTLRAGFRLGSLAELAESYHACSRRVHFAHEIIPCA